MREDEEDYDELPPITVNSSGRDSSVFSMPRAGEVAAARARERSCERELARLRERPAGAPHSDSSGSEGEAALAAAVTALRVRTAPARAPTRPYLGTLLAAAAPLLPEPARPFLLEYARTAAGSGADRLARLTLSRIESRLAWSEPWAEGEACTTAAWLCLALAATERTRLGPAALRAAHCLLGGAPTPPAALLPALLHALPEPRARLDLADALRCGAGAPDALAARLVRAALRDLLSPPDQTEESEPEERQETEESTRAAAARWRALDAGAQYAALQLAARARRRRLLAALAAAPPAARQHTPDALKVLVAASKMQVLFPGK